MPARAGGGTASIISTGGLRGLNPDQTLILVNGKRRHKTSLINSVSLLYQGSVPTDLGFIPTSAVERIEVLRDGAAAQYGSDAIAGVINIILKDNRSGGAADFTAGQNFDRSDGESYTATANIGTSLGQSGFADFFINLKKQERSNRANPIPASTQLYVPINGAPDPREATADRLIVKDYGAYPSKSAVGGYNAEYDLGGMKLYSFGTYGQRQSLLSSTFRQPNNAVSLPQVYPNGFRPVLRIAEEDLEFALGIRGEIAGWNWDVSSTYGQNRARETAFNTINASLGPTSPTSFYVGTLRSSEWVNSLDVTKSFDLGKSLEVSAGFQHRRETYGIYQGDPLSYAVGNYTYVNAAGVTVHPAGGGQAANGFRPADEARASRNNVATYVDLVFDVNDRVTVGGAARFEHYDDGSGNTVIGKLNGRYALTPWLALRGAASTGFRAPSLAQQSYASTTTQSRPISSTQFALLDIKTLPVASPAAIALGAVPLKPEKSVNLSAGLALSPLRNLSITVDAYQIKIDDRIALTSALTGSAVSAILVANGLPSNLSGQYYANAIDTRTRGVDVVATYNHRLGDFGTMRWNLGYNYNKTIITRIAPTPAALSSLGSGLVLFDRTVQSNLTVNLPNTKLFIGNTMSVGDFTLNSRIVRYGEYAFFTTFTTFDKTFGAKWITDVELSWKAKKNLNIAIGADNIFNVYPDATSPFASMGAFQYQTTGSYGFTGGFYYARIGVSF